MSSFSSRKSSSNSIRHERSFGGQAVPKTAQKNSIAHQKKYSKDGKVEDDQNAEAKLQLAMRAKAARRAEIVGEHGAAPKKLLKPVKVPVIAKNEECYTLIKTALEKNILFNDCTEEQIDTIIKAMKPKKIAKGTSLITEGDEGYNFYVVQSGVFDVMKSGEKLREYAGGDCFGELSLLYDAPRATTITTQTAAEVWKLDRITFRMILDASNEIKREKYRTALKESALFQGFSDDKIEAIVDIAHFQSYRQGDVIIKKGDEGNFFYVIASGRVQVTRAGDLQDLSDTIFGIGDYFGERSLLTGEPRSANVIAIENTDVLVLDKEAFERHLNSLVEVLDHNLGMRVLQSVDLLQELEREMFDELCDELRPEFFNKGATILKEGDIGKKFYIIKSGRVEVLKLQEDGEQLSVAALGVGGFFGELGLLNDEPRAASVVATTDVQLFSLERDTFERLFGPLRGIERTVKERTSELTQVSKRNSSMFNAPPEEVKRERIRYTDLKVLSTLGTGTFGRVKLVQHNQTGNTYALKILQKQQIVEFKQQANVMNEKKVMMQSDHPFILKLYETYRDKHCLYMLLELVQGGELFTLLHSQPTGKLSNHQARFYAACVVDALDYLHKRHIVYRDLKPENLMIDTKGYIKVVDFGFAKVVQQKTYTLCGTPEYLAPELVLQKGHNKAVDYWAVGVLIFEMLHGVSPFADLKRGEQITICRNIVRLKFEFPRRFPAAAKNLVQKLLKKLPHERLGMERNGAQDIKNHKWFDELNWTKLLKKDLNAPWMPTVQNNLDISNFELYDEEEPTLEYVADDDSWDAKF